MYGIIKAGGSIIFFTWFIDKFGRKWPWIVSSLICAFCQYYLAIYISLGKPKVGQPMSDSTVAGGKAATAMIMIFGVAWSVSGFWLQTRFSTDKVLVWRKWAPMDHLS